MNIKQLQQIAADGGKIVVGEFRGGYEVKEFPDKKIPGKFNVRADFKVLFKEEIAQVGGFLKGVDRAAAAPPCPYQAGDKVVVQFRDWQNTKFGVQINGTHEKLTA